MGVIENADGVGEIGNAKCGDIMKIYLKIEDDIISDVKFETFGCGSAIASSSMATEMIKGKPLSARRWSFPTRRLPRRWTVCPRTRCTARCLAEEAIKAAVKDYYDQQPHSPTTPASLRTARIPVRTVKHE